MVRYYPLNRGYTPDTAFQVDAEPVDIEHAGELCASDYHDVHDGWEAHWPVTLLFQVGDGPWYEATVEREARPYFYVTTVDLAIEGGRR